MAAAFAFVGDEEEAGLEDEAELYILVYTNLVKFNPGLEGACRKRGRESILEHAGGERWGTPASKWLGMMRTGV